MTVSSLLRRSIMPPAWPLPEKTRMLADFSRVDLLSFGGLSIDLAIDNIDGSSHGKFLTLEATRCSRALNGFRVLAGPISRVGFASPGDPYEYTLTAATWAGGILVGDALEADTSYTLNIYDNYYEQLFIAFNPDSGRHEWSMTFYATGGEDAGAFDYYLLRTGVEAMPGLHTAEVMFHDENKRPEIWIDGAHLPFVDVIPYSTWVAIDVPAWLDALAAWDGLVSDYIELGFGDDNGGWTRYFPGFDTVGDMPGAVGWVAALVDVVDQDHGKMHDFTLARYSPIRADVDGIPTFIDGPRSLPESFDLADLDWRDAWYGDARVTDAAGIVTAWEGDNGEVLIPASANDLERPHTGEVTTPNLRNAVSIVTTGGPGKLVSTSTALSWGSTSGLSLYMVVRVADWSLNFRYLSDNQDGDPRLSGFGAVNAIPYHGSTPSPADDEWAVIAFSYDRDGKLIVVSPAGVGFVDAPAASGEYSTLNQVAFADGLADVAFIGAREGRDVYADMAAIFAKLGHEFGMTIGDQLYAIEFVGDVTGGTFSCYFSLSIETAAITVDPDDSEATRAAIESALLSASGHDVTIEGEFPSYTLRVPWAQHEWIDTLGSDPTLHKGNNNLTGSGADVTFTLTQAWHN